MTTSEAVMIGEMQIDVERLDFIVITVPQSVRVCDDLLQNFSELTPDWLKSQLDDRSGNAQTRAAKFRRRQATTDAYEHIKVKGSRLWVQSKSRLKEKELELEEQLESRLESFYDIDKEYRSNKKYFRVMYGPSVHNMYNIDLNLNIIFHIEPKASVLTDFSFGGNHRGMAYRARAAGEMLQRLHRPGRRG